MSHLVNLQPRPGVSTFLPEQVVTDVRAATVTDRAEILRAYNALVVDLQDVDKDVYLWDFRFLDTCPGAPNLQESET
jgi:hypothetical protein